MLKPAKIQKTLGVIRIQDIIKSVDVDVSENVSKDGDWGVRKILCVTGLDINKTYRR